MKCRLLKGLSCAASATFVLSLVNIAAASTMYLQGGGPDGIISIEAENYTAKEAIEDHYWELTTEKAGFSGKGAMAALPDDGANEDIRSTF